MKESRRCFIKAGVKTLVATTAVVTTMRVLPPPMARASTSQHPYGYTTLDVEETRQLGYDGYHGLTLDDGAVHQHCSFATFNAIISQLAEADPEGPYAAIPTQMLEWASGGVSGYATFCGALNGACAAIGLICDNSDAKLFISDLLAWYARARLPSNIIAPDGALPRSVAGGNLCHLSVTQWCLRSGYASSSSERPERCARLAGDVAAMAVKMLNVGVAMELPTPGDRTGCRNCHYKGDNFNGGQFTRGKMDCLLCHDGDHDDD